MGAWEDAALGRRVACGIKASVDRRLPGRMAGPCLPLGSSGDAGCTLGGSRAVLLARQWPHAGMEACCNSALVAC